MIGKTVLPALSDDGRSALLRMAMLLCASSVALLALATQTPPDARAAAQPLQSANNAPSLPSRMEFPAFTLARDPFVSDAQPQTVPGDERSPGAPESAGGAVVRAIILGVRSRALIEIGGTVKVLEVGDRVDGVTISAIDRFGVHLSNGRRIAIEVSEK